MGVGQIVVPITIILYKDIYEDCDDYDGLGGCNNDNDDDDDNEGDDEGDDEGDNDGDDGNDNHSEFSGAAALVGLPSRERDNGGEVQRMSGQIKMFLMRIS